MRSLYLKSNSVTDFPGSANFILQEGSKNNSLPCFFNGISKLNIFVGENNSGKSRFLRGVMQQDYFLISRVSNFENKLDKIIGSLDEFMNLLNSSGGYNLHVQIPSTMDRNALSKVQDVLNKIVDKGLLNNQNSINLDSQFKPIIAIIKAIYKILFSDIKQDEKGSLRNNFSFGNVDSMLEKLLLNIIIVYLTVDSCVSSGEGNNYSFYGQTLELNKKIRHAAYELVFSRLELINPPITYIPILRSARTLYTSVKTESDSLPQRLTDIYFNSIVSDYKIDSTKVSVETGLDLYKKIKRTRNQVREVRKGFELFENFLSKTFFGGKALEIVAKDADDLNDEHISVLIDDSDRDIHFLGDGIQALIVLLYPIFMAKEGSFIFIEEPELNMHPGMQRIFMNTLLSDSYIGQKKLTVFITTHSNHLLNTSFDFKAQVSILLFNKVKSDNSTLHKISVSHSRDLAILNSIGVINSSVFLSNCSIWVEGITDRLYIRKYVQCLIASKIPNASVKEDVHYSFLEYAGSNLAHYLFSNEEQNDENVPELINGLSIANRILLIADLDEGKEDKHDSFRAQINDKFDYYSLPVREVENLLSARIIKDALPEFVGMDASKLSKVEIHDTELQTKSIGTYLKSQLVTAGVIVSDKFEAKSGTLSSYYKTKLSNACVKHITWDKMSPSSKDLAKHVLNFIISQNRGGPWIMILLLFKNILLTPAPVDTAPPTSAPPSPGPRGYAPAPGAIWG